MSNQISEYRIRENKLRRKRQFRRNIGVLFVTMVLILGCSATFFVLKAKAQPKTEDISYKYYKSVMVKRGDTLWDFAETYADNRYYDSYEGYIQEVMEINHLQDDKIIYGQHIIVPYYSKEFISASNEPNGCLQTFMTIESLLSIVWRMPRWSNTPPLGAFQI